MNAREFLDKYGPIESEVIAKKAGTTLGYFRSIAYGTRKPSPELTKALVAASRGRMKKAALRFDIYG